MNGAAPQGADPRRLLAPGAAPLVARSQEVEALRRAEPGRAPPPAPMPFIGAITDYAPGRRICVERMLSLAEDLHLADHHFVPARPHKPLSACYPVLPLTFSLEAMAEVAACLAPGMGLVGIEQVGAGRWIALADRDRLALSITAQTDGGDGPEQRVAVAIRADGERQPAISAVLVYGPAYRRTLAGPPPPAPADSVLDAAQIYARRQLFHGPSLRCLRGRITVAGQGASGTLLVRAPDRLFASTPTPQLLTDPALMDGVGQLIGIWAMQTQQRVTFPIGIDQLEYYAATPAPGSLAEIRIHTVVSGKFLRTDVEIGDGAGALWLRIRGWKSWQFRWDARLLDFRRHPQRYLLSEPHALAAQGGAAAGTPLCRALDAARIADFDRTLLARHYLHADEMAAFEAKAGHPPRQLQWLLGRIAAKDAARAWAVAPAAPSGPEGGDGGPAMPHPATIAIDYDALGRPRIAVWPLASAPPWISIAHCASRALAVAHDAPAGVDIEHVGPREAAFVAAFSNAAERAQLPGWEEGARGAAAAQPGREEWLTRLWCAKEAQGKLLGTGLGPSPRDFALLRRAPDQALLMRHRPSGAAARVTTLRDGPFICALGLAAPR